VIDTLQKIRPKGGNRYEGVYEKDYGDLADLQTLALDSGIAIIVIHHERKAEGVDDYDRVSGSAGITGAADTVWIWERKDREKMEGTLIISGRDIEDCKYGLTWDKSLGVWMYQGTAREVQVRGAEREVLDAIQTIGKPASVSEIQQICGKTGRWVYKSLKGLLESGVVEKSVTGHKYVLAPESLLSGM
jgi:hypothetical protein